MRFRVSGGSVAATALIWAANARAFGREDRAVHSRVEEASTSSVMVVPDASPTQFKRQSRREALQQQWLADSQGRRRLTTSLSRVEEATLAMTATGSCRACMMNGPNAPRMYIHAKKDGLGASWQSVIFGMAVAQYCGMTFGGVLQGDHTSHGVGIGVAAKEMFGITDASDIFPPVAPKFDAIFPTVESLKCPHPVCADPSCNVNIVLDTMAPQIEVGNLDNFTDNYFSARFVDELKAQAKGAVDARMQKINAFQSGKLTVAMHVRRGDVGPDLPTRYTANEWYYFVLDRIKEHFPNADIHMWSSGKKSEFDGFEMRGVKLHLDSDEDPNVAAKSTLPEGEAEIDAWANFVKADVFITAQSAFSWIPALMTEGCVIYSSLELPMPRWYQVSETSRTFDKELLGCIFQRASMKASMRAQPPPALAQVNATLRASLRSAAVTTGSRFL